MATIIRRGEGYQIDYFDPTGKRIRKSFQKRKEAEAELGKRVSLIAEGRYLDVKRDYTSTLGELITKYTENFLLQTSFQNWKRFCLENFKVFFGEETRLVNIRYVDLETYRNHLRSKPTPKGTRRTDAAVNRELSCLHHLFRKAAEWEMVERSPFDRGKSLLLKENNKRLRFLSEEEIAKLLVACPTYLRKIVECALLTGMRKGEILSLRWAQIRNGFIYLEKTKTNEAREIPIGDSLDQLFREIRREQQLTSPYVFTYRKNAEKTKGDKPVREKRDLKSVPVAVADVKKSFNTAVKRVEIEDFKFHDLRHTSASQMVMRGASLKEV
jgi:integrase